MANKTTLQETELTYPLTGVEFARTAQIPGLNFKAQLTKTATPYVGGRLTLTSGAPVLTTNTTAQSSVYFTPYFHDKMTLYDGTGWTVLSYPEDVVVLDTTNVLLGKIYDVFAVLSSGVPNIGYGPAWTTTAVRSLALSRVNGILVNDTATTIRRTSSVTLPVSSGQGTYVGSFYATANGQTGMTFQSSGNGGGTNHILGLYNYYNKVHVEGDNADTVGWSYASSVWRVQHGSSNNSIGYLDGGGDMIVNGEVRTLPYNAAVAGIGQVIGITRDSTSTAPDLQALGGYISTTASAVFNISVSDSFFPSLGFHTLYAMEAYTSAGSTAAIFIYGSSFGAPVGQTQHMIAMMSM